MMLQRAATRWGIFKAVVVGRNLCISKCLLLLGATTGRCADLHGVNQLVVSVPSGWDATNGRLQCLKRDEATGNPALPAWPVLYGKNGLVWGRGVRGTDEPGPHKGERDG